MDRGYVGSHNGAAQLLKLKSCVDFTKIAKVEIVCRFHQDRVSISPGALKTRSYVDFARSSLEFSSDLENFHRGGECRERVKNMDSRVFFKLYERIRSTGRSTDVQRG